MRIRNIGVGIAMLCLGTLNAQQIKTPKPSPYAEVEQVIGLTEVELSYSRPGKKGRAIFGDLVPYDKLWRTGANLATTIEAEGDIMVGDKMLKEGKYSVFTIPGKDEWIVIINSDATASTARYTEEKDVLRIKVKPVKTGMKIETFTMLFANLTDNSADWQILWDNVLVTIPIKVEVDKAVMDKIAKVTSGPSSRDLYVAAQYYYNNDKDIKQSLSWINKAVEMDGDDQKFWVVYWQAMILAKSGDKKGAIAAAEKSKQLATEAKYDSYVKKNDDLINSLK